MMILLIFISIIFRWYYLSICLNCEISDDDLNITNKQGLDLYAFIGFIGPDDDDDLYWLLILIFDY